MSLDDERRTFFPIPWNETEERKLRGEDTSIAPDRLLQVWFPGVHANVGGGYPDDTLAQVPLCWMIEEATEKGLRFMPWVVKGYTALEAPTGQIYNSRAWGGLFYRYQPRDVQLLMGEGNRPLVHHSVVTRMAHGNDGYAPISLPHDLDVLAPYGLPVRFNISGSATKRAQLQPPPSGTLVLPGRDSDYSSVEMEALLGNIETLSKDSGTQSRKPLVDLVLDTVWYRRLVYFASLLLALTIIAFPLFYEALRVPGISDRWNTATGGVINSVTGVIEGLLPGFVKPWLVALVDNPTAATFLLSALGVSLAVSDSFRSGFAIGPARLGGCRRERTECWSIDCGWPVSDAPRPGRPSSLAFC